MVSQAGKPGKPPSPLEFFKPRRGGTYYRPARTKFTAVGSLGGYGSEIQRAPLLDVQAPALTAEIAAEYLILNCGYFAISLSRAGRLCFDH